MKNSFSSILVFALATSVTAQVTVTDRCTVPGTVAITFDDGPYIYTKAIADQFTAAGGKVTFYLNGLNYGCIYDKADEIQAAYNAGHQIASHSWSHMDLATLSNDQVASEMTRLNDAFRRILGTVPLYMRPPYGSYNAETLNVLSSLGFKNLAMWSIDSGDSAGLTPAAQQQRYNTAATDISHNVLQHGTYENVVREMVPFIINWAKARNLKMVTVGECLGDPVSNWYGPIGTPEVRNSDWVC